MSTQGPRSPLAVVSVDDDDDDRVLLSRAFAELKIPATLVFARDGDELMALLEKSQGTALPSLILLDLNMPRVDGRQVLMMLKNDDEFKKIPVIVISTSKDPADVSTSYSNGANSYFCKPEDFAGLLRIVLLVKEYWVDSALLPG